MTAKDLLKPRFEIIADYPDNHFGKIGTILDRDWSHYPDDDETKPAIWKISDFPHLFKKLNWWEYRNKEDMPKYVKSLVDDKGDVYKIKEWDMELYIGWLDEAKFQCCSLRSFKPEFGYIPVD